VTDKILAVQLDPNGYCNAKCWYCPVQYGQTRPDAMTPLQVEQILSELNDLRQLDTCVS
jgi:MoaA/NifB/PqqE/SkfB family radical SAM enzyme